MLASKYNFEEVTLAVDSTFGVGTMIGYSNVEATSLIALISAVFAVIVTLAFPVTPEVVAILIVEVFTKLIPFAVTVEPELEETGKLATPDAP